MALVLYLTVASGILTLWSRRVQRITLAAAIVLVALPLLFTGRALFTGRVYAPADISFMAEPLHAYARELGVATPHNILLSDLHCQILPWQKAVRYALANGEWPLWNPFILGGDILAAAAQPAVYDPLQWLGMLLPLADAFTFGAAMTFFLAGFFTFAFARDRGLGEVAAFAAAAAYMFCGMLAFFVGWPLGRSWAYLPLVLFSVRRPVLLTIAFVLLIVSGHPESVLHVVFVGALWGVYDLGFGRRASGRFRLGDIGRAFAAGAIALALTAVYLLPFAEAVPQTLEHYIRHELYATTSYDVIAKPEVRLDRMKRTFVPGHRSQDPLSARVGPIVVLLALWSSWQLAVGTWRRHRSSGSRQPPTANRQLDSAFFLALALICLSATFGTRPVAHFLHALPLFDIAINERLAFAAAFAMAMLAAFAIDAIRSRPIAVVILAAILVERSIEDGNLYPALNREAFFPRVPLIAAIPRDARMTAQGFAFTANNPAMYALEDVRGYQAMTFRRLHETYPLWSQYQQAWFNRVDDLTRPFLSFLNVRYAIGSGDVPPGWRLLAEDRGTRLFENTRELPRVFVPRHIRFEKSGEPVLAQMKDATDFLDRAWIEVPELAPHDLVNGAGHVTIRRSGLAYEFDASMEQAGWVVVSTTAWKGWRAYIDGRRVETRFANHAFLGVYVPKGTHRVSLKYLPSSFTRGRTITLATIAILFGVRWRSRRRSHRFGSSSGAIARAPAKVAAAEGVSNPRRLSPATRARSWDTPVSPG